MNKIFLKLTLLSCHMYPQHLLCECLLSAPAAAIRIQLPDTVSEKAATDGLSPWVPAPHLGDSGGTPGSWPWPGSVLLVMAI